MAAEEKLQESELQADEKICWEKLSKLYEETRGIIGILGEGSNKKLIQTMITAIKNKDINALRRLTNESEMFLYRTDILRALNLPA